MGQIKGRTTDSPKDKTSDHGNYPEGGGAYRNYWIEETYEQKKNKTYNASEMK